MAKIRNQHLNIYIKPGYITQCLPAYLISNSTDY
jgi:hypothetical protein